MKQYLSIAAVTVSVILAIAFFLTKRSDNAQHDTDVASITDFSNRLDLAQTQISIRNGNLIILSNTLAECTSAALSFSNRLAEAQSSLALQSEKISDLTRQVTSATSENQKLGQNIADLNSRVATLTNQLASTQASLDRTNQDLVQSQKDYAKLENRFLRDVAERVVVERRFNSYLDVKAQLKKLETTPTPIATPESIYAGLNVLVRSNGTAYVISPE